MWTLTLWTLVITPLALLASLALHKWLVVRRSVLGEARADRLDGFWRWLWDNIKRRWDMSLAALGVLLPVLWSAGLDTIIIVVNLAAELLPVFGGADLSALMISDLTRSRIQIAAVLFPPVRAAAVAVLEKIKAAWSRSGEDT